MSKSHVSLEASLLSKRRIDSVTNCWLFVGALKNGYGQIVYFRKHYYAHRVSAHLYLGLNLNSIIEQACHKEDVCPNKHCFNPEHLYVGDYSSNLRDRHKFHPTTSKGYCRNGHEYTFENMRLNNRGHRVCITCTKKALNKYRFPSAHHDDELLINKQEDNQIQN